MLRRRCLKLAHQLRWGGWRGRLSLSCDFMMWILDEEESQALESIRPWISSMGQFPVPLDGILELLSLKKGNFKRALIHHYKQGVDYQIERLQSTGGRPSEAIHMSLMCVKDILMSQTCARGKRVRRYFLLAEEVLRRNLLQSAQALADERTRHAQYQRFIDEIAQTESATKNEDYYQDYLEQVYSGQLLPRDCLYGEMDIHLKDRIIEIKSWDMYKNALGQLLAYNAGLGKTLQVAFFGPLPDEATKQKLLSLFSRYDIVLSYFDEQDRLVCTSG